MDTLSNPLFLLPFLVGLVFVIMSMVARRFPPKGINAVYGYRTKRSMSSKKSWIFAQEYSNTLMNRYGCMLIILGVAGYFTSFSTTLSLILSGIMIVFYTVAIMLKTEGALKENFEDE